MNEIPNTVRIGITMLQPFAVGDTIEDRFRSVIRHNNLDSACWMTTNEDHRFRAAVGALMLSYGPGTPEFERIEDEMRGINQISAIIQAAQAGLSVDLAGVDPVVQPIGLMALWHARDK